MNRYFKLRIDLTNSRETSRSFSIHLESSSTIDDDVKASRQLRLLSHSVNCRPKTSYLWPINDTRSSHGQLIGVSVLLTTSRILIGSKKFADVIPEAIRACSCITSRWYLECVRRSYWTTPWCLWLFVPHCIVVVVLACTLRKGAADLQ